MKNWKDYLPPVILVLTLLLIWEMGARWLNMPFILPSPAGIAVKLWEIRTILFLEHLPATIVNYYHWTCHFDYSWSWPGGMDAL